MARKEEIKQAAKVNASQMCNLCLDKYCQEMGLTCPNFNESVIAFTNGAEWADEHINLKRLWHNASEVPQGPYIVLCDGLDNRQWVVEWLHIDMSYANWQDYVESIGVSRWAYISDLLPKGGEK